MNSLTAALPEHIGLLILAGSLVIAFALALAGVMRVVRESRALTRRFKAYADLSVRDDARLASRRIALAERRIDTIGTLTASAENSIAQFGAARDSVTGGFGELVVAFRRPRS